VDTYTLDFLFLDDRKSELPHTPIAHVCLKTWCTGGYKDYDPPLLTPQCVTLAELECQIDRLKEELETIREEAQRKFAAEAKRHIK